ncbi:uncharacterized protein LOC110239626 isoform X2 [Exaiptasia diaphana]|uniref:Uncharacterized protein n=1 Tax=Exaiptasia diaphana TaxID=2652724 RepID=A0A913YIW7_EXADI|nr:uncharacterized protein LOC110239626 isoform X2 [Exaiptasia diaphana]
MAGVDSAGISLIKAARDGDLEQVHRLIEGGACVNAVNENDQTALMILAQHCRYSIPEMAIALINGGSDINMKDKEGKTALMHAIAQKSEDIALAIIKHSKDLDSNAVDNQGETALMYAIDYENENTALAIMENCKDLVINTVDNQGQTALMKAVFTEMKTIADALITRCADVNIKDKEGQTALMKAAFSRGMTTFALALIKRGADVNVKDKEGETALMYSIAYKNDSTAFAIIENSKDLDINTVDNQGQTALMKAAFRGMTTIADALIKCGADVNIKDKKGQTALMYAIDYDNENTAHAIMENSKDLDINTVDNQGQTSLMKAAVKGMTIIADALITRGADVDIKDEECKTALMHAITHRDEDTAFEILKHSKDLDSNSVDNQGQTALMKAAIHGKTRVIQALIRYGANVNHKDKEGKTALMHAVHYKRDSITAELINHETSNEFSLNTVDNEGETALMKAAFRGMTTIADALTTRGADVNIKDKEGQTALMYAIANANKNTALAIIENCKDLDINTVDNQGQTALMKAAVKGMTTIADALITRGADVNIKDKEGKTPLMNAIAYPNENTALAIIMENSKDLNLDTVDNQGQTALMKAAVKGMATIADALITRGADVNIKDKEGQTALMYAIANANKNTALAIIENSKDLDINTVDNQGQTALMKAAFRESKTNKKGRAAFMYTRLTYFNKPYDAGILTHKLISAGADVNKTDNNGNTALMYNVRNKASVKELIERGKASVEVRNDQGRTVLFYALVQSISSARYLVENGANLHLTDNYNVSVLSYFIHHWMGGPYVERMDKQFSFLKDNGIKKETIVNTIVNAVFCKFPLLKSPVNTISITSIISCLTYAIKLSKETLSFRKDNKCRLLQDLVVSIKRDEYSVSVPDLSIRLDKLLELGADPNTCDEHGNTIAHHITLLGMHDNTVEAKSFFDVLFSLEKKGLKINKKNGEKEIPLFLMLTKAVNHDEGRLNKELILDMCIFFLERDRAILTETSQTGDSVFHLLIKLSIVGDSNEESLERCIMEILRLFSQQQRELSRIVNSTNDEMNTPLHVWAAGSKAGKQNLDTSEILRWQGPSEKILDLLLSCGAVHHATNLKKETPLHMCRTWTAVKLLFKAGAKTNDEDALGRSPLLSAAKNCLFLENPGCFYPDVSPDEAPTFWETVLDMGFDLWTCDRNGDSIISILIKENSFELADGLIKITCEKCQSLLDETLVGVLNAICKDASTQTTWKSILVDKLLKSTRRSLDVSSALRSCCMNIIDYYATLKHAETTEFDSVHYEIVKQLLRYGAPGESCLDVAEGCPPLKALLSTPVSMEERPLVIPWTSVSQKHKNQLAEVARRLNCNMEGPYWYHRTEIGHGSFGQVFVGIHEKDRMEVAVKKVRHSQQHTKKDIREIRTLASLSKCEHIVRYLTFFQIADYSFIIMELMEGNLIEYFASAFNNRSRETKELCRDVVQGLKYLHDENVIHRDLKPNNILYNYPKLCLKIADFGLSCRIDVNASFTVMAPGVGTRGWIAPEVTKSTTHDHSTLSDVFSCGLVFHYILSKDHRHPFSPADCTDKSELEIITKTENNILNNNMEGWDSDLDPESSHVITGMLNCTNEKERPTASMLLHHPMFWSKKKKLDFLSAVGNQDEFECPRNKRPAPPLRSDVEKDLEKEFATIVEFGKWDDPRYTQTSAIFIETQKPIVKHDKKGKPYNVTTRKYDIGSAVELVRFIRNAIAHVSEASRPTAIRTQILEDAVFLDEFPNLVIEVFKAVTEHEWDKSREEIKHVLAND